MKTSRHLSRETWHKIYEHLHILLNRGFKKNDKEILYNTDMCIALLRKLASDLQVEDRMADRQTELLSEPQSAPSEKP